jgi:hypothetical protein
MSTSSNSLFTKLPPDSNLTERQLQEYFSRYGNVKSVNVRPNGTCFVKMGSVAEAQAVMAVPAHEYSLLVHWDTLSSPATQHEQYEQQPLHQLPGVAQERQKELELLRAKKAVLAARKAALAKG